MKKSDQTSTTLNKNPERKSDSTLIDLNKNLKEALEKYVHKDIKIRFDIPDKDHPPNEPTLCVFLYDIQEDLEMRHGQPRQYQAGSGQLENRYVNVRCCYLITYWEKIESTVAHGPNSQSLIVMNQVLNALLNIKTTMQSYFSRVIEPSEHLAGLGNFWQSLGNKPRLCLNYAVTIPIQLASLNDKIQPVVTADFIALASTEDLLRQVEQKLKQNLIMELKPSDSLERAQLERLSISCHYVNSTGELETDPNRKTETVSVTVSGLLTSSLAGNAIKAIDRCKKITLFGLTIFKVNHQGINSVAVKPDD